MPPPPPTDRLTFHEMELLDLDDMAELFADPLVMRHYDHPFSRDESRAWVEWGQRLYREHGHGLWLLRLRMSGELVGDCGLTPQEVDGETSIEVGYHVRSTLQGNGYATGAAEACRTYAASELGLRRLIAIIEPANAASQRVAEKIGLPLERATRDRHDNEVLVFSGDPSASNT